MRYGRHQTEMEIAHGHVFVEYISSRKHVNELAHRQFVYETLYVDFVLQIWPF
jgi:hypothetical protein